MIGKYREMIASAGFLLATACFAASANAQPVPEKPASPPQRTVSLGSRPQEFLLTKIAVSDLARSYEFYTKALGLKPASPQMPLPKAGDPEVDFREFPLNFTGSLADPFFVLVQKRGAVPTPDQAALVWIGFKVPDANAALDRAAAAGAQVVRRASPGAMGFAFARDPDGYNIEFIQVGTPEAVH